MTAPESNDVTTVVINCANHRPHEVVATLQPLLVSNRSRYFLLEDVSDDSPYICHITNMETGREIHASPTTRLYYSVVSDMMIEV